MLAAASFCMPPPFSRTLGAELRKRRGVCPFVNAARVSKSSGNLGLLLCEGGMSWSWARVGLRKNAWMFLSCKSDCCGVCAFRSIAQATDKHMTKNAYDPVLASGIGHPRSFFSDSKDAGGEKPRNHHYFHLPLQTSVKCSTLFDCRYFTTPYTFAMILLLPSLSAQNYERQACW